MSEWRDTGSGPRDTAVKGLLGSAIIDLIIVGLISLLKMKCDAVKLIRNVIILCTNLHVSQLFP